MDHAITTLIGPNDWTKSIGKETSNTSFGVGALKRDDMIVTTLYPSKYPEKIWSLLFPLSLSDSVHIRIENIDRNLGETIIALDLLKMKNGAVHVGELVDRSMLESIIKGTVIEGYSKMDPDPAVMREGLFDLGYADNTGDHTNVVVDQSFQVKGVGCVVLGFVTSGEVAKHQELFTIPGGKRTQVRSIQIHDKDHDTASSGSRVGLAMKNITPDDLPRGTSLSSAGSGIEEVEKVRIRFRVSDHWKGVFEEGEQYHISNSLQFTPGRIMNLNETTSEGRRYLEADVALEGRIWTGPGNLFGLAYLDSRSFRLIGAGESI